MTGAEIHAIVRAVLEEQQDHIKEAVESAVVNAFGSFGIHDDERKELRADFQHLRKWRRAVEHGQSMTMRAAITVLVSGFIGAFWLGFKAYLGK